MGLLKSCIFYSYTRKNKSIPVSILIVYAFIIVLLGILTFNSIFSVIHILWSVLSAYATWQDNLKVLRILTVIIVTSMLVYNIMVGAYANAIGNIFQIIVAIIAIFKLEIMPKNEILLLSPSSAV